MLIEYMQLLSVLRLTRLATYWGRTAEAVLLALSVTPISSYAWMSIECALPAGMAPDSYAYFSTLATTMIPGKHGKRCLRQLPWKLARACCLMDDYLDTCMERGCQ
jgi:hypothetical protein